MARDRFSNEQIVERTIREYRGRLLLEVQRKFDIILYALRSHLDNPSSRSRFDAPNSRRWFAVKIIPQKVVIAFGSIRGVIKFDIDTYPGTVQDITDPRNLFSFRPNPLKPNKVHVAIIDVNTSKNDLDYFIRKMREAIDLF